MKAFEVEKAAEIERNKKIIDLKLKIALDMPINEEPLDDEQISVAHQKIFKEQS